MQIIYREYEEFSGHKRSDLRGFTLPHYNFTLHFFMIVIGYSILCFYHVFILADITLVREQYKKANLILKYPGVAVQCNIGINK